MHTVREKFISYLTVCAQKHGSHIFCRDAVSGTECSYKDLLFKAMSISSIIEESLPNKPRAIYLDIMQDDWCAAAVGYIAILISGNVPVLSSSVRGEFGNIDCLEITDLRNGFVYYTGSSHWPQLAGRSIEVPDDMEMKLGIVMTSGTTGYQKAILLDIRSFSDLSFGGCEPLHQTCMHAGIPFKTSIGLHAILLRNLLRGREIYRVGLHNDVSILAEAIFRAEVHEFCVTPHCLSLLSVCNDSNYYQRSEKLTVRVYAGHLSRQLAHKVNLLATQAEVFSIYGLTEGGDKVLMRHCEDRKFSLADITSYRIWVDTKQNWAEIGEIGEICIKEDHDFSPRIIMGDVSSQNEILGWKRTGDIGQIEADGTMLLLGRIGDYAFCSNRRLSIEELEQQLELLFPRVDLALINLPHGSGDRLYLLNNSMFLSNSTFLKEFSAEIGIEIIPMDIVSIPRTSLGQVMRSLCCDIIFHKLGKPWFRH